MPDENTGSNNYELSKQGSAVISNPLTNVNRTNKKPEEQSCDEWLSEWEQT